MGIKGTDAAKEAAEIVLADDNFATIANAVREGRVIYDNIKKALLFTLPTNGGEAAVIVLATFLGLVMPVTAPQILWVNLVTEVTLAIALAFEPAESDAMRRMPRDPAEPLLGGWMVARIAFVALAMGIAALGLFLWELERGSLESARTVAVNALVAGEIAYLFNCRRFTASMLRAAAWRGNDLAFGVTLILVLLQLAFTYLPWMNAIFHSAPIDAAAWALIIGCGAALFLLVEIEKALLHPRERFDGALADRA
jgi:magnesium-transporting ATPase (P-type)